MKKFLLSLVAAMALTSVATAETVTFPPSDATEGWTLYSWTKVGVDYKATVGNFTFLLAKNNSANDPVAPDKASIRVYAGANLTITAPSGYVMTEVSGTTASESKALGTTCSDGWTNQTGTIEGKANQPFKFTATTGQAAITFDGAGKQLRVKNVTITYQASGEPGKSDPNLSFPQASYTVNLGDAFTAPTVTKADGVPAATYSSSNAAVATVNATSGAVNIVAAGTTTITATTAETADFYQGTASYTIEVIDPNAPGTSIDNPMTVAQALAACQDKPEGVYVKGIVKQVTTEYSTQYKNVTFTIVDAVSDAEVLECYRAKWGSGVTAPGDNNPEVGATVVMLGDLLIYNNTKKEMNAGCQIVKYEAPVLPSAGLSFPEATYTINLGESFTAPVLSKVTPAAATYASSNTAVADVDAATGAVTVNTYGSVVITATTAATSEYLAGEASYTLIVLNPAITKDAPLTVAQALAVCENAPHNVFVKGIVKEVTTEYNDQYKNVSFTIVDAETDTEVLECFRAKWGEGVTATSDNNPQVGATVIMNGDLLVYNGKKELNAGNTIVYYDNTTGVEGIASDNAPVEYFNLQGMRVSNPQNGIYIRVQGKNTSKVMIR